MFKYWAIKKYCNKLTEKLQSRYGVNKYYSASQVRATVYQCDFNPTYLPLGYILHLNELDLATVMASEFPNVCVNSYKKEIIAQIEHRSIAPKLTTLLS